MKSFGEYIRDLRKKKGLNQTQLAAKLGLDMSAISKIENGKAKFKESLLTQLSKIFDLDFDVVKEKFYSDKFANEVYLNKVPETVFKVAEKKLQYFKTTNAKQIDLKF